MMIVVVNIIAVLIIILSIYIFISLLSREAKYTKYFSNEADDFMDITRVMSGTFFIKYRNAIQFVVGKGKYSELGDLIFILIIILSIISLTASVYYSKFVIGIVLVLIINYSIYHILLMFADESDSKISKHVPDVIDVMLRVMSRVTDLKQVIYLTSKSIDEPLKSEFELLTRKMHTMGVINALDNFSNRLDNIWINGISYILKGFATDVNIEEVKTSLRELRDFVRRQNETKAKGITDKKYGIVLNYVLAVIAIAACIMNIIFNPIGKNYFFNSVIGVLAFTVGMSCVLITIVLNIKMTKGRKD